MTLPYRRSCIVRSTADVLCRWSYIPESKARLGCTTHMGWPAEALCSNLSSPNSICSVSFFFLFALPFIQYDFHKGISQSYLLPDTLHVYAQNDAFLSAMRAAPQIVLACYGLESWSGGTSQVSLNLPKCQVLKGTFAGPFSASCDQHGNIRGTRMAR
jgi:hypothetical protein